MPRIGRASVIAGAQLLLAAVGPLQKFFDRPPVTHQFCLKQAIAILNQDGYKKAASFFNQGRAILYAGVAWADKGLKNVHHYFEPVSRKGLWHFASAADTFGMYYRCACHHARRGELEKTLFFLGAAAHLVQDMCVPHHVRAKVLLGHQEYEDWACDNREKYACAAGTVRVDPLYPNHLIFTNAEMAADLFDLVVDPEDYRAYHQATSLLLPQAQRSTAGLLLCFYEAAACRLFKAQPLGMATF